MRNTINMKANTLKNNRRSHNSQQQQLEYRHKDLPTITIMLKTSGTHIVVKILMSFSGGIHKLTELPDGCEST